MRKFNILGLIEITVTLTTEKAKVRRDMKERGKIWAIKLHRDRTGCSLKEALDLVRELEAEGNHVKPY